MAVSVGTVSPLDASPSVPRRRWSAEAKERIVAEVSGLLRIDGYAAYPALTDANRAGGPVTLAACST